MSKPCSVPDCPRPHKGKGLCAFHYGRAFHGRKLDSPKRGTKRPCNAPSCSRIAGDSGLCRLHYQRMRKGHDLSAPIRGEGPPRICAVEGCNRRHKTRGYCAAHYKRLMAGMSLEPPIRTADHDIGYRRADGRGYVKIKTDGGWKQEHRHVMEQRIGRPLRPEETVHHVNGDRADNRIGNLELWSSSQPAGQRVHDKVKWARMMLSDYGDLVDRMMV